MSQRPVLTFALISFNQEPFVREAVEAAFAQTYSPLEIVLSDACSEDRSFEIMRGMAAGYKGPHRLILNRMPARKAIGGHLNRVMEISRGELIFCAAADDVSLPGRTEAVYRAWEGSGRRATSVHSDYTQIDANGREIPRILKGKSAFSGETIQEQKVEPLRFIRTLEPVVFGCTHAFSRSLFRTFGNLLEDVTHEDDVLAFRSVLAGKLIYINQPLVKYRMHSNNVYLSSGGRSASLLGLEREEERLSGGFRNREIMHKAFLADLTTAKMRGIISQEAFDELSAEAGRLRLRNELMYEYLGSGFLRKCRLLLELRRQVGSWGS